MARYTIEQSIFVTINYYQFYEKYAEVGRKFRTEDTFLNMIIRKVIMKFEENGYVDDEKIKNGILNWTLQLLELVLQKIERHLIVISHSNSLI